MLDQSLTKIFFQQYSSDGALMEHFKTRIEEKNKEICSLVSDNATLKVTFARLITEELCLMQDYVGDEVQTVTKLKNALQS